MVVFSQRLDSMISEVHPNLILWFCVVSSGDPGSTSLCKTPFCSWYVGPKSHFITCPSLDHVELSLTNNLCNRLYFFLEQALVGNSPFNSMWCYWKNTGMLSGAAVSVIYPLLRVKPTHVKERNSTVCEWHLITCPAVCFQLCLFKSH